MTQKKLTAVLYSTFLALAIMLNAAQAQTPNTINYQGVARNTNGTAVANQNIKVRFSFRHNAPAGTVQYSEARTVTTDANGLFSVQIGSPGATTTTGTWGAINWKQGDKFLQVEIDKNNGVNYVDMGTQQLASVPYAQLAKQAQGLTPTATVTASQIAPTGAATGQVLQYNGTAWAPATLQGGGGSLTLPYAGTNASANSFQVTNTAANGTAIYGYNAQANGNGIEGEATTGKGVVGYAGSGIGVDASTYSGTAIKANGGFGYALDAVGKVKISGGNTSPGLGKVLTSDAAGNATWQAPSATPVVGFMVGGTSSSIAYGVNTKFPFNTESYDIGNNFNITNDKFTAPYTGLYHFSMNISFAISTVFDSFGTVYIELHKISTANGIDYKLLTNSLDIINDATSSKASTNASYSYRLEAGDEFYLKIFQVNSGNLAIPTHLFDECNLSGHLVAKE